MLGAINGLEQTAKPFPLWLIDPVITADWQGHLERLKELQSFVRLRKMRTMLLARAGVETAEAVHALADNACCGGVVLDMVRLGTLHRTIELAGTARKRGLEVVLAGVKGETAVQAALALNPALVMVGAAEVSNIADEMNRAVGWMSVKK
jgi:L-alanine-DL-glutamate epimerase-like enolase superfamily enzyme